MKRENYEKLKQNSDRKNYLKTSFTDYGSILSCC